MQELDTLFGRLVCAFATGLGRWTGNYGDAVDLCMFIHMNEL